MIFPGNRLKFSLIISIFWYVFVITTYFLVFLNELYWIELRDLQVTWNLKIVLVDLLGVVRGLPADLL